MVLAVWIWRPARTRVRRRLPQNNLATCQVVIDNAIALEVRLTLYKLEGGKAVPVFEGTSAPDGIISLKPVGQAALAEGPSELVGIIESTVVPSGNWLLPGPTH